MGTNEMNNLIIGLDVDGCLADFNVAYKNLIVTRTGRDGFGIGWTPDDIRVWNYPQEQYGYSNVEIRGVWTEIKASPTFWNRLAPYDDVLDFLRIVRGLSKNIYFITNRAGETAKFQTESWLKRFSGIDIPTVLISEAKGSCCSALKITHYIDDKTENCSDVSYRSSAKCYMLVRPWNQPLAGVSRINSLNEFLGVIKDASRSN